MESENKDVKTDELDLWDLLSKIGLAIKSFFVYILRRSILLLVFIVLGVLYCIYLSSGEKKFYSSTVQFRSKNVNCAVIISQIDALNGLLKGGKYEELASMLQVPKEDIEDVRSMKGLYAFDVNRDKYPDFADVNETAKGNLKDTTLGKMNDYFYLKLDVYSDKTFGIITRSLENYMGRNEFIRRENELALVQHKEMIDELKRQVTLLDSFQRVSYFEEAKRNSATSQQFNINSHRPLYHEDYIKLYDKLQKAEMDLDLYSDIITLTQDFPPLASPENSFSFYLKKQIWKFLVLGLLFAIIWDHRKFLLSNMLGRKGTN